CISIPSITNVTAFNRGRLLHLEAGVLVDRTVSRVFTSRTICAGAGSLGTFIPVQDLVSNLPSISGHVTDSTSNGIGDVTVVLAGPETHLATTSATGAYSFGNLASGGNYAVTALSATYSFNPTSKTFVSISGNQTADFVGSLPVVSDTTPPEISSVSATPN